MKVLVTGHRGYIGSVMTTVLERAGHDVIGLDCDLYAGCDFGRPAGIVACLDCDLRDVEPAALGSFDAVIHLAALSDDATTDCRTELADEINYHATIRLAKSCKRAGVPRFLFASSCGVYGRGSIELLPEHGAVNPLSRYAELKLRCEREIAGLADHTFTPVFLRNATVYGVSPRLRLDLVVNDFAFAALLLGRITMRSAGAAWRPFVHVEDLARVYLSVLTTPIDIVHNEVFNIVGEAENYRVIDIADMVAELLPECTRCSANEAFDQRSYRVDGAKLARILPHARFRWTLSRGIRQLFSAARAAGTTPGDWRSDRYRRAPRLQALLERGELDASLRRAAPTLC